MNVECGMMNKRRSASRGRCAGSSFIIPTWAGYFVPAGTPREIAVKLNVDIVKVLQRQDLKERFAAQGAEAVGGTAAELAAFIRKETGMFATVIRAAKIAAE